MNSLIRASTGVYKGPLVAIAGGPTAGNTSPRPRRTGPPPRGTGGTPPSQPRNRPSVPHGARVERERGGSTIKPARDRFRTLDSYRAAREWLRYEGTPQRELFRELRRRFIERHTRLAGWVVDVG